MHALQEALEEPRTRFSQINQKIIGLDREISDCQDKQAHLEALEKLTLERYELRRAERKLHLEEKLKEIKEDIRFCSKWGRSEYFAVLLSERELNHKALIIETIKVIEDFDPKIFNNKMVERRGKPTIVLTPGTGNGSYDFRSNTIIIPVTSPHSVLESLAYAFALYRKDIDQEYNESKMWESFFSDDVWRGIKDRDRPRHLRNRMIEFVKCYTDWITKESRGLMVLDLEIRRWFEENIAPEKRGLIVPRELRHVKIAEREKLLHHYMQSPAPHSAYMAGVLLFKMGDFEQSDKQFERAMELAPESPEPHWAKAILLMLDERDMKGFDAEYIRKMRLKDRLTIAKDELQKFTKIGDQSWWTLKAQEHIRRLSEQIAQFGRR
jgi:tetratricopeptide (TPR) repeat protein